MVHILVRLVITEMVVKLLKLGPSNAEVDFLWVGCSTGIVTQHKNSNSNIKKASQVSTILPAFWVLVYTPN